MDSSPYFKVTAEWCAQKRQSVQDGALEQLERQQRELDSKRDFWRGYLAGIEDLEESVRRAAEGDA